MEHVKCMKNMVEELDMEPTNNTNLALFFEMVEWLNKAYHSYPLPLCQI